MFDFINLAQAQVRQVTGDATARATLYDRLFNLAFFVGGALAVIYLIYAGFIYMTAGADTDKATQGRNAIMYAIIGILVIAFARVIVEWFINLAGQVR